MPGPEGCAAAAIIHLAHPSVPGAFASHEDANGELTAIALPRSLLLLNLPTDHDLAAAAAHRPAMNLVEFNELVAELMEDQAAVRRAAISMQSALRGWTARSRKAAKKRKSKQPSGDLDAKSMAKYVSGLDISAVSGQLALLELSAPSLQLHALSGLHTFPALTSLDLSDNALTTLQPLAALAQLSWLNASSNMLREGLNFEPPPAVLGGSRLRYADLRDNVIVNPGHGTGARRATATAITTAAAERGGGAMALLTRLFSPQDEAARAAAGRLGIFSPAGVVCSAAGPAWARGELEPPQGSKHTVSGFLTAVYTAEQQERLGIDEAGASEALRIRTAWLAEGGVAGVARHPELQTLLLDGNRASSLAGMEHLINLRHLSATNNRIRDAAALRGLATLRDVDLAHNLLDGGLAFLPSLPALASLKLSHNGLQALPSLDGLGSLSHVDVSYNDLADVENLCGSLKTCDCLRTLEVAENPPLMQMADLRLHVLHRLPMLTLLDGAIVSALEKVGSHNMYGKDAVKLEVIRKGHMCHDPPPFSAEAKYPGAIYPALSMPEMPGLLEAYAAQYTAKFNGFTTAPVFQRFSRGVVNTGSDREASAEAANEPPAPTDMPQLPDLKRGATMIARTEVDPQLAMPVGISF